MAALRRLATTEDGRAQEGTNSEELSEEEEAADTEEEEPVVDASD